ncbi:MAG: hypothetical protein IJ214_04175 [Clostridia bacterium]|nr:hypothetical protein [Clostridia bacterium]
MPYLAYMMLFAAMIAALFLLAYYRRERQKELYRMDALRNSRLYRDMKPLIQRASVRDLDQVRIERDRITITRVHPPGTLGIFELRQAGHMQMSRTRTRVMAEVIAEDLEILQDRGNYTLTRYRVIRPNGTADYSYLYTIRSRYKDSIMAMHRRLEDRIRI